MHVLLNEVIYKMFLMLFEPCWQQTTNRHPSIPTARVYARSFCKIRYLKNVIITFYHLPRRESWKQKASTWDTLSASRLGHLYRSLTSSFLQFNTESAAFFLNTKNNRRYMLCIYIVIMFICLCLSKNNLSVLTVGEKWVWHLTEFITPLKQNITICVKH